MFFCRAAYAFPALLRLSFYLCFSVLIIAFASSSLCSFLCTQFTSSPSLLPFFCRSSSSSSSRAPLAVTESQRLPMLEPSPKFIISVHSVHALRPSEPLGAPRSSCIPAKHNVTAPPQPSFTAITGQISPSKAPVCSLIDGTPAFPCTCT